MPYRCAFYRELYCRTEAIEGCVYFLDDWGNRICFDPTMNVEFKWSDNVLQDIPHVFLRNLTPFKTRYTGADKTVAETKIPFLGNLMFSLRTYFSHFCPSIFGTLRRERPDVVIVENYSSFGSFLSLIAANFAGAKVYLRGEAVLRESSALHDCLKRFYLKLMVRPFLHGYMHSSLRNRSYYYNYFGNDISSIFVPSAVGEERFELTKEEAQRIRIQFRDENNIGFDDFVFIGVGRLVERKNWSQLVLAFTRLVKENRFDRTCRLVLVGDGPERLNLEVVTNEDLEEGQIIFTGFLDEDAVRDALYASDVIVQTSHYDPSPKAVNEGIMAGLPAIVSSAVGTANELVVDNFNGYVYDVSDDYALSSCMESLCNDSETYMTFSDNTLKKKGEWSVKNGVDNILSVFLPNSEL